jgi:hypothetical protein
LLPTGARTPPTTTGAPALRASLAAVLATVLATALATVLATALAAVPTVTPNSPPAVTATFTVATFTVATTPAVARTFIKRAPTPLIRPHGRLGIAPFQEILHLRPRQAAPVPDLDPAIVQGPDAHALEIHNLVANPCEDAAHFAVDALAQRHIQK